MFEMPGEVINTQEEVVNNGYGFRDLKVISTEEITEEIAVQAVAQTGGQTQLAAGFGRGARCFLLSTSFHLGEAPVAQSSSSLPPHSLC